MKIILANEVEVSVNRISRNIDVDTNKEQFMITFSKSVTLEDVAEKLADDTCKEFTLKRDGSEDVVYSGYDLQNISESISDESENVMATLTK